MTEAEWLVCEDPQQMLAKIIRSGVPRRKSEPGGSTDWASERKLRLFACAIEPMLGGSSYDEVTDWAEELEVFLQPEITLAINGKREQANLLRDIVGNPYRPVKVGCSRGHKECKIHAPDWLTPTVLSLAQAAYDERPGRKCERCPKWEGVRTDEIGYFVTDAAQAVIEFGKRRKACICHGTGRIEDGTLDPFRLMLVAEALEDAGCTDEAILMHLRGLRPCSRPFHDISPIKQIVCPECDNTRWVPSPGPHVRGCFVLDAILKKE
jgi:hypothetical protein